MKKQNTFYLTRFAIATFTLGLLTCRAADFSSISVAPLDLPSPNFSSLHSTNLVNYVLRVDWTSSKGGTNSLQLITSSGTFKLDTSLPSAVKAGESEFPSSVSLSGDLQALNLHQGRLQLFLGRSVPYVVHTGGSSGGPSVQQRQEGLNSNFLVTFGKPVLIQKDPNGEVTVLVERQQP